jgi:hypothetical protein
MKDQEKLNIIRRLEPPLGVSQEPVEKDLERKAQQIHLILPIM